MKIRSSGFTTVELLITMLLAGLLLALAVPSYGRFVASSRVMDQTNDLVAAFTFARSEAIKRNRNIFVCRAATAASNDCAGTGVLRNYIVTTALTEAAGGVVLRRGTLNGFSNTHYVQSSLPGDRVRFGSDGLARTSGGALLSGQSYTVCSTRYSHENIRRLTLGAGSRISTTRESGTCS